MTDWAKKAQILNPWVAEGKKSIDLEEADNTSPEIREEIKAKARTDETAEKYLKSLGALNLKEKELSGIAAMPKACLLIIMPTAGDRPLGRGVINDAITVCEFHKKLDPDYWVFYHMDPKKQEFIDDVNVFLEKTKEYLTILYSGHGEIYTKSPYFGYYSELVFADVKMMDFYAADILKKKKDQKLPKTLLIHDACFTGNFWLIPDNNIAKEDYPKNLVSISSVNEIQGAAQGFIDKEFQGVFTFLFWKALTEHPTYSFLQIQQLINDKLRRHNQECCIHYTSPELVEKPFFSPKE